MTEVTFRDRRSTLRALDVWMWKDSRRAQGIVRVRGVTEVTITGAVPLCALDVWMWMTFRDRRSTLWALGGWTQQDSWQSQGIVRLRGVTEVTFRDRRSTLWALGGWTQQDSWQSQGIRDKRKTSRSQLGMPGGGVSGA